MSQPLFLSLLLLGRAVHGEQAAVNYEKEVRPILKAHCTHCHGEEEKPEAELDLRLRRLMTKTLEGGKELLVPGQPENSELVQIIRRGEMPKKGEKVSAEQLAIVERWITEGAKTTKPEPDTLAAGTVITDEDREFWAFQPIVRKAVPNLHDAAVRTPVDAFLLEKMRPLGLSLAPEANRRVLIRRATLDLTGLLPDPSEVEAFVADPSPDAYEKLVEKLLDSQAYGERWARHWLDVVGYADSNGYSEADSVRPHAWRYRDYVVRQMNEDRPWDEFIQEQLAGDELAGVVHENAQEAAQDERIRDLLIATGFLRMAPDGTGETVDDPKLARNQVIAEQIKITTSSLLGLTVACAQCHDHRYDPITQADYYRVRAIFDPAYDWEAWRSPAQRLYSLYTAAERAQATDILNRANAVAAEATAMGKKFLDEIFEVEVLKLPVEEREPYRLARSLAEKDRTPEQSELLKKYPSALALYSLDLYSPAKQAIVTKKYEEAKAIEASVPREGFIMALTEQKGKVPATKLFHRGDHDQPKQEVAPGELGVLTKGGIEPFQPPVLPSGSSGRRTTYARWLTSGKHPLVSRVLVNRFWLNHMGRGIVNTPGDFGSQGERPTHPELLDWLADEFVRGDWRLKPLHRLIMLSSAYRQSSTHPDSLRLDPEGALYARFKLRRLEAETLRDSMLAAGGSLISTSYGSPSEIGQDASGRIVLGKDKGDISNARVESGGEADFRRSIYVQVRRSRPVTVLGTFDAPTMVPNCEMRSQTTVAPQSLLLMNDTFIQENARRLAARVEADVPSDRRGQIQRAWMLLYSQTPTEADVVRSLAYLEEQTAALQAYHQAHPPAKDAPQAQPAQEAMGSLCQILCSSNRFLYIE